MQKQEGKRDDLWGKGAPRQNLSLSVEGGSEGGVWGQRWQEPTEHLTTSSISGLFLANIKNIHTYIFIYFYLCVWDRLCSKCGAVGGKPGMLVSTKLSVQNCSFQVINGHFKVLRKYICVCTPCASVQEHGSTGSETGKRLKFPIYLRRTSV